MQVKKIMLPLFKNILTHVDYAMNILLSTNKENIHYYYYIIHV